MLTFGVIRSDRHQTIKLSDDHYYTEVTAYEEVLRLRCETEDYRVAILHISRDAVAVREEKTCEDTGATWEEELYTVPIPKDKRDVLTADGMVLRIRHRETGVTIRVDYAEKGKGTLFYLDVSHDESGLPSFTFGAVSPIHMRQFLSSLLKQPTENRQD